VRDPFRLAQQLHAANLHFPEVLLAGSRVPTDGSWLVKPLAGSGGSGIAIWRGQRLTSRAANGHYFQKPIEGEPHSAVYFGDGQTASLLGVTRQLVGEPWLHAKPFAYCGSIGPALLSACTDDQLLRLGVVLARAFNLRGLFGVDFVLHEQDSWLVEVNPRYTASVEVLELSLEGTFIHLVAEHFGRGALCIEFIPAWGKLTLQSREPSAPPQWRFVVKAVYFAKQDALYNVEPSELQQGCLDVPRVGTQILAGHPVLSLIEVGSSVEDCLEKLTYVAAWLDWRLYSR
jgi:predicted ATP-grasp superfamily ATP-dependent carboligase